jgi:LmbE family N-acetylglucosaminyl deacetylase
MTMRTIVSVGAHPDDVEVAMGGTLAKHNDRGDEVNIILFTLGGVSGDPKQREEEARTAANILGARLHILDYPVSKLNTPTEDSFRIVKKAIDAISPDRVYTHSPFDYHQVHVAVSQSVTRAAKDTKQILLSEQTASTNLDFRPNAFVDITSYIDLKVKSIEAHGSQSNKYYMHPNVVRSLANTRYVLGKLGSNPYGLAEAFKIHKFVLEH